MPVSLLKLVILRQIWESFIGGEHVGLCLDLSIM